MKKPTTKNRWAAGFTLLELMISIGIVALLATIAVPAYQNHVLKTKRADAQTALLELAHFMERSYAKNGGYLVNGAAPTLPFSVTPRESGNPSYQIGLSAVTQQTYTLQAQPTGGQVNDPCGTLTLDNAGVTTPTTNNCWVQ
jgi:type IV pilus assembly protein PilE